MSSSDWRTELRDARKTMRLSQRALAELAGISAQTVKAYELGLRGPRRENLEAILDALKLEARTRNRIFAGAGFVPAGTLFPPDVVPDYFFTVDEAEREIESYPWPACVVNDVMEVVAANLIAQQLWGVDLHRELAGPVERNLLSVASTPRFAEKVANWDEAVSHAISILKGHHRGPETQPGGSGGYFAEVMRHFLEGDTKYVARFLALWETTPARSPKSRWWYPIVLEEPGVGTLRFRVLVSTASEPDGLSFNDWVPLDLDTWGGLEEIRRRSAR